MTRSQFAWAILADEKWLENSARLLGLRLRYTRAEARWLGLVRLLSHEVGLPLEASGRFATEALRQPPHTKLAVVGVEEDGDAGVSLYLARYHSTHSAALSAAMELGGARRRGRRRVARKRSVAAAARYGVDIDLLREGLKLSTKVRLERADENATFINALRSAPKRA